MGLNTPVGSITAVRRQTLSWDYPCVLASPVACTTIRVSEVTLSSAGRTQRQSWAPCHMAQLPSHNALMPALAWARHWPGANVPPRARFTTTFDPSNKHRSARLPLGS
jgi:hypothetical protein